MIRILLLLGGIALGLAGAIAAPNLAAKLRGTIAALPGLGWLAAEQASANSTRDHDEHDDHPLVVKMTAEQIGAAGITIAEVGSGFLQRHLQVPGTIIPSGDRIARVAVKLLGTVAECVQQGEVVAVIESREVADAKSEFMAARLMHDLQQTLAARAKNLAESKSMAENEYLRVRNAFEDARVKRDTARQKLLALGLNEQQIEELLQRPGPSLERQELRAPISGKVAERRVDLGALVGREGLESELYVIVDPSEVWAELAIAPADLPAIREGQQITVASAVIGERAQAKIMFVSPLLDKDTRAARVIALLPNAADVWRPGSFIAADIPLASRPVGLVVPKTALQSINGEPVVFVRTAEGFEKRVIRIGREDEEAVEIIAGLVAGERIAVGNTFTLKAELGKAGAADQH
jgi:cobalt-zinc-cadmium efflux system membrane fusion protein